MVDPYRELAENTISHLMALVAAYTRQHAEIKSQDESCSDCMDDGFLLSLLDHPLVKSGRIKITISNTSADEL